MTSKTLRTFGWLAVVAVLILTGGCGTLLAQTEDVQGLRIKELHTPPATSPFVLDAQNPRIEGLTFLPPESMSAVDRTLVEANENEIVQRAERQGFSLSASASGSEGWGYEQAICPAFPQHVILEYSRGNRQGDITLFSVVIPRGEGHVRVIPARRRGYSLFTPVASNDLTINDFNHIVLEEGLRAPWSAHRTTKALAERPAFGNADWLTLGLCYSALASGHVRAALQAENPAQETYPLAIPAQLRVSGHGEAEVWFADATPEARSMEWQLRFAGDGRLLKVRHVKSNLLQPVPVKGQILDVPSIAGKR